VGTPVIAALIGATVVVVVNALMLAAAWGSLRARVTSLRCELQEIKAMLGNGEPGVFMRRAMAEEQHENLSRRIEVLERK